jgi:hypothetical protein
MVLKYVMGLPSCYCHGVALLLSWAGSREHGLGDFLLGCSCGEGEVNSVCGHKRLLARGRSVGLTASWTGCLWEGEKSHLDLWLGKVPM